MSDSTKGQVPLVPVALTKFKKGDYVVPVARESYWDSLGYIRYPWDMLACVGKVGLIVDAPFTLKEGTINAYRVVFTHGKGTDWAYLDDWIRLATEEEKRVAQFVNQVEQM